MDAKTEYSDNVSAMKKIADIDGALAHELEKSAERAALHKSEWTSVNINDVVDRFAPDSSPVIIKGKIYFYNENRTIAVVADAAGGYLRIQDLTFKGKKDRYLTLDGKDGHNVTINGKTIGRTKSDYEKATHYRILKRSEM